MNRMLIRKNGLQERIHSICKNKGFDFKSANRFRLHTFKSDTRNDRIRVMGEPTRYFEIIHTGGGRSQDAADLSSVLDTSNFRVNLWFAFSDAGNYEDSSEFDFDKLCYDNDGIIPNLIEEPNISGAYPGWLVALNNESTYVTELDKEGTEFAHYLTFTATIR